MIWRNDNTVQQLYKPGSFPLQATETDLEVDCVLNTDCSTHVVQ